MKSRRLQRARYFFNILLEYQNNQWSFAALECAGFFAARWPDSTFYRVNLADHLKNIYFLIFLAALARRYMLIALSDEVAPSWSFSGPAEKRARDKSFEVIRDRLHFFTARGFFSQIAQKNHHHQFYLKCQAVFQIQELYTEAKDEITEMHNYLIMQQAQDLETRLGIYGALIGVPTLVLGLIEATASVFHAVENDRSVILLLSALVGAGYLTVAVLFVFFLHRFVAWLRKLYPGKNAS